MTKSEQPKFRKTKTGEWVAFGPTSQVRPGTVKVRKANGTTKTVQVTRTGKPFNVDGIECCYGYLGETEEEMPRFRTAHERRNWECRQRDIKAARRFATGAHSVAADMGWEN